MARGGARAPAETLGSHTGQRRLLLILAVIAYEQGDLARAVPLVQEGLAIAESVSELWVVTLLFDRLAIIAGETEQAVPARCSAVPLNACTSRLGTGPNAMEQADRDRARDVRPRVSW